MPYLLNIKSAKGTILKDTDGQEYFDLIAGIAVASVGHAHPRVVQAVQDQIAKHGHVMVYGEYIQESVVMLAAELTSSLPENLKTCYFVNSGAEANEASIKLAKRITGRSEIVSFKGSYHGSTQGATGAPDRPTDKVMLSSCVTATSAAGFHATAHLGSVLFSPSSNRT